MYLRVCPSDNETFNIVIIIMVWKYEKINIIGEYAPLTLVNKQWSGKVMLIFWLLFYEDARTVGRALTV